MAPWMRASTDTAALPDRELVTAALVTLIDEAIATFLRMQIPRTWHELDVNFCIPDLLAGRWPKMCNDRRTLRAAGRWHVMSCMRRSGHLGRHAAGDGNRITAVWEAREVSPATSERCS